MYKRQALKEALDEPLLGEKGIQEARNILVSIIGSPDLARQDVVEAMNHINDVTHVSQVAFGLSIDEKMQDEVKVTLIATGIEPGKGTQEKVSSEENVLKESGIEQPVSPSIRKRLVTKQAGKTGEIFDKDYFDKDLEIPPSMRKKDNENRNM